MFSWLNKKNISIFFGWKKKKKKKEKKNLLELLFSKQLWYLLTLTRLSTASLTTCIGRARSGIALPSSASSWRITSLDTCNTNENYVMTGICYRKWLRTMRHACCPRHNGKSVIYNTLYIQPIHSSRQGDNFGFFFLFCYFCTEKLCVSAQ